MLFTFSITAPANTAKASATKQTLKLKAGIITRWSILIPDGHAALAHLIILDGETQIIPWGDGQDICGNAETLEWEDDYELPSEPAELEARAWNDSTRFSHTFYIRVWIRRRAEILAIQALNRVATGVLRLLRRLGVRV